MISSKGTTFTCTSDEDVCQSSSSRTNSKYQYLKIVSAASDSAFRDLAQLTSFTEYAKHVSPLKIYFFIYWTVSRTCPWFASCPTTSLSSIKNLSPSSCCQQSKWMFGLTLLLLVCIINVTNIEFETNSCHSCLCNPHLCPSPFSLSFSLTPYNMWFPLWVSLRKKAGQGSCLFPADVR